MIGRHPAMPWARPFSVLLLAVTLGLAGCASAESDGSAGTADTSTVSTASTEAPAAPSTPTAPPSPVPENDDRSLGQKLEDASLEAQVQRALVRERSLRVFDFSPTVVRGTLTLRGDVNTADQYRRAQRVAGSVDGIEAIANELTLGGRPATEERLAAADEASSSDDAPDTAVYHTVRAGDTLWDIARKYSASVDQIRALNNLRGDGVRPGQRLRVR
jgi:osmotically-inducible protein OsmY